MLSELLLQAIAEAVFSYLLEKSELARRLHELLKGAPQRRAFEAALASASLGFADAYPDLERDLLSRQIQWEQASAVLARCLVADEAPSPQDLACAWGGMLASVGRPVSSTELTAPAAYFLSALDSALRQRAEFDPFFEKVDRLHTARATERAADTLERIEITLDRFAAPGDEQPGPVSSADAEIFGPPFDIAVLPHPEELIGRQPDLDRVKVRLRAHQTGGVTAIRGMPGIGKTAIAAKAIIAAYQEGIFPAGIAVINCQGMVEAAEVLRRAAARFDPRRLRPQSDDIPMLTEKIRDLLDGKRALVVLDNVEPDERETGWKIALVVAPLRAAHASVLMTSRQVLPTDVVPREGNFALNLLSSEGALQVFAQAYGKASPLHFITDERAALTSIIRALERHTLAVKLAGAYAAEPGQSLATLAQELANPERAIDLPDEDVPHAVARAFAQSVVRLPADARTVFAALAAFGSGNIGEQAALTLAAALGVAEPAMCMRLLVRHALVDSATDELLPQQADRQRLRLHPLIRAFASREWAQRSPDEHETAVTAVAHYYAAYATRGNAAALALDEGNIIHVLEAAHERRQLALVVELCDSLYQFWHGTGRTATALRYLTWGAAAAEHLADVEKTRQATLRHVRLGLLHARTLRLTGSLDQAAEALSTNLVLRRDIGDRHGAGVVHFDLGRIALERGAVDMAEVSFKRARDFLRDTQDVRGEAMALSSLGDIALRRSRLAEAEGYFELALLNLQSAGDRRGEGMVLSSLGQIDQERGKLSEAMVRYERSLRIFQEEGDRRNEAIVTLLQGQIAEIRGDLEVASDYYRRGQEISIEIQYPQGQGNALRRLGRMALSRGRPEAADELLAQALTIHRTLDSRSGIAADLAALGGLARARGKPDQARRQFLEALEIYREIHDPRGESAVLLCVGLIAEDGRSFEDAVEHYTLSLRICERIQDHAGEAQALLQLGRAERALGDLDRAEAHNIQSLAIIRQVQRWRDEGAVFTQLGQIAQDRGQTAAAEHYYRDGLRTSREAHDLPAEGHASVLLGQLLRTHVATQERLGEALAVGKRALEIYHEIDDQLGQIEALGLLGQVAYARGDLKEAERYHTLALPISRRTHEVFWEGFHHAELGRLAEIQDRPSDAESHYALALGLSATEGDWRNWARVATHLSELYFRQSWDSKPGRTLLRQAIARLESLGESDWANRLRARAAELGIDE